MSYGLRNSSEWLIGWTLRIDHSPFTIHQMGYEWERVVDWLYFTHSPLTIHYSPKINSHDKALF
jgi:hypothetical protein